MLSTTRRRVLLFVLLAVAVGGLAPLTDLLDGDGTAATAAAASTIGPGSGNPESPTAAPAPTAAPVIVVARTESLVKYLDLVIRLLTLLVAWFLERKENGK